MGCRLRPLASFLAVLLAAAVPEEITATGCRIHWREGSALTSTSISMKRPRPNQQQKQQPSFICPATPTTPSRHRSAAATGAPSSSSPFHNFPTTSPSSSVSGAHDGVASDTRYNSACGWRRVWIPRKRSCRDTGTGAVGASGSPTFFAVESEGTAPVPTDGVGERCNQRVGGGELPRCEAGVSSPEVEDCSNRLGLKGRFLLGPLSKT